MAATVTLLTSSQAGSDNCPFWWQCLMLTTRPTGPLSPFKRVSVKGALVALPQWWPQQSKSFLSAQVFPALHVLLSNLPQEKHFFFFFQLCLLSSGPACWGRCNVNFKLSVELGFQPGPARDVQQGERLRCQGEALTRLLQVTRRTISMRTAGTA